MKRYTNDEVIEKLQTFTNNMQSVNLATVSKEGDPYASYSPFVEDDKGNYYIFISTAVMHSHNMSSTKKAHIMFLQDESDAAHIYARQRLYFKVDTERFKENDIRARSIFKLFDEKFKEKVSFFPMQKDSRIYKLIPKEGTLVLGFGAAYKISSDKKSLLNITDGHSSSHAEGLKKNSIT